MTTSYRRRKPALLKNLWVYRNVIAVAGLLGLIVWFCWSNRESVIVVLPFGLRPIESWLGVVILLSVLAGSGTTALVLGLYFAVYHLRLTRSTADVEEAGLARQEERPPSDYASKTKEGFSGANWSKDP